MTGAPAILVLTRHGQTVWHAENRYAGVSDVDLTDEGRAQAVRLAVWATGARLDGIVSSPVRRARETAGPVAHAVGLTVTVVDDLREIDFGTAEGRTMDDLAAVDPRMVAHFRADPVAHHFPGGEPPAKAAERAVRALRGVAADHAGRTVLVVAHNTLVRLALCRLLGIDLNRYRRVFPRLDNAALTTLALSREGDAALLSFNVPLAPH